MEEIDKDEEKIPSVIHTRGPDAGTRSESEITRIKALEDEIRIKGSLIFHCVLQEIERAPIKREDKKPIGTGSWYTHKFHDYSYAKLMLPQGHKDHVRSIDLTFADRCNQMARSDISADSKGVNKRKQQDVRLVHAHRMHSHHS